MISNFFLKIHSFCFQITYSQSLKKIREIHFIPCQNFEESKNPPYEISLLKKELEKGLKGEKTYFPEEYLDFSSLTENEIKVLQVLKRIPIGSTLSYSQLGEKSGFGQRSGRFIGNTMRKNPFPVLFPCHRIIRKDGNIGNYTGGNEIKTFLLNQENLFF